MKTCRFLSIRIRVKLVEKVQLAFLAHIVLRVNRRGSKSRTAIHLLPLQQEKRLTYMKSCSCKRLIAFALSATGLMLTGCQQAPPAAAPAATAVTVVEPARSDDAEARRRRQEEDARVQRDRSHPHPPPAPVPDRDRH